MEAGLTTTVCVGKRRNTSIRLAQIRFLLLINCVLGEHEGNSIVICVSTRERDSFLSSTLRTSMKFQTFIIFSSNTAVISSFEKCNYLCDTQAVLIHIGQIEHGLCTVMLVCCDAVVCGCCFIVFLRPITIVMVISNFHSSEGIPWEENQKERIVTQGFMYSPQQVHQVSCKNTKYKLER